jgi:AcrR family transcriptional regulator
MPRRKGLKAREMTTAKPGVALFSRSALQEKRREAIILAAATAFNRTGFHNTSMDEIAAALQTSKPTLYQFFKTKQKLLFACHQHAMDYGEVGLALAEKSKGSGREKLALFARAYMDGIMTDFGASAFLTDVGSLMPEDRVKVVDRRARISAATRALIERGQTDGSVATADAKLASLFLLGVLNSILIWYRPGGDRSREEIVEGFIGMLETGLAGSLVKGAKQRSTQAGSSRPVSRE